MLSILICAAGILIALTGLALLSVPLTLIVGGLAIAALALFFDSERVKAPR